MDDAKKAWGDLKRLGKQRRRAATGNTRQVNARIPELKYVRLSEIAGKEGFDNVSGYLVSLINQTIKDHEP